MSCVSSAQWTNNFPMIAQLAKLLKNTIIHTHKHKHLCSYIHNGSQRADGAWRMSNASLVAPIETIIDMFADIYVHKSLHLVH